MYQASVPTMIRVLNNLAAVLEKAAAHCEAKKIDPSVLVNARLYPDMFPLKQQVQIASDTAKAGGARLAGMEPPSYTDDETTFPQLVERARKTVKYLETLKPEQIDGGEDRTITWKAGENTRSMQGQPYLLNRVFPNLFFHASTAYGILRHNGVDIGKQDFLGKF
jgi:hypothetical protein